ncbi:Uncharacterised protein [Serratia fonticola]|uniref:Uncharacterized protein n=1 Tax=Serratia fonticola TaxID=47917 RepID=A0A4U9WIM2_SERFO|nr:Uncharacterised protein [Serratia fonticola]
MARVVFQSLISGLQRVGMDERGPIVAQGKSHGPLFCALFRPVGNLSIKIGMQCANRHGRA